MVTLKALSVIREASVIRFFCPRLIKQSRNNKKDNEIVSKEQTHYNSEKLGKS